MSACTLLFSGDWRTVLISEISARRNGPNPAVQQQEAQRRAAGRNAPLGGAPPANE